MYEELGGFSYAFKHCVDWDMWKRIVVRKPILYEPEPLACYRLHTAAESSRSFPTGENVSDERLSIDFSLADVPPNTVRRVRREARKMAGIRAARRARLLWQAGNRRSAWGQFKGAALCSLSPAVMSRLVYFLLRAVVR